MLIVSLGPRVGHGIVLGTEQFFWSPGQEVEISNLPHEKMLHVVMPVAFQNLTFVKADMNKCIAHFAPFQYQKYFEICGLQHGLDEPENSSRIRTSLVFPGLFLRIFLIGCRSLM